MIGDVMASCGTVRVDCVRKPISRDLLLLSIRKALVR